MTDWARITAKAEQALTLDAAARADFLRALDKATDSETVTRLVKQAAPTAGFLATSAPHEAPAPDHLEAGARIGPWQVERPIGRGGMGEVYAASRADGLYEQTVALKLMQGMAPSRAALFEAERRRLALMDHPGIARIIDGGATNDGRPWMAMDYVDGVPITEAVAKADLSRRERLRLFSAVCDAAAHAHGRLIVHRDIKGENVLVDGDGHPRLIDFGIASELEEDTVGGPLTLATAAPEQLKGEPVSVQTDVFALGVLLHELITGARPARQSDGGMAVDEGAVGHADLSAILRHCLATDPGARYGSAEALSDDISAVLAKRPVAARPTGWPTRFAKFTQRYPLASVLGGVALAALIGGLAVSLKFASDARAEAERARAALAEAEYQYEYANANLMGQNTYGTILYELFAEEGRADALTETLLERWRSLHEIRDQSPELAASVSFVIGRNFFLRRDHANAQEVLGTWLEAGHGPAALRNTGREFYAMSLFESGRRAEALPIMREVMESYENGHKRPLADQLNFALRLATLTNDPADIDKAEQLYNARAREQVGTELTPAQRINQFAGLLHIRKLRDDHAGAIGVARDMLAIYDAHPDYRFGRTVTRINLAELLLYAQDDASAAEATARQVLGIDLEAEGESAATARGHFLLARALMVQGRLDEAGEALRTGAEMQERYTGLPAGGPDFELARAEWLAASGDTATAREVLEGVSASAPAADLALVRAYVDLVEGRSGDDVAAEFTSGMDPAVSLNYRQAFMYRRLLALGMPDTLDAS